MENKLIKVTGKELFLTEDEALKQFEKLIWKFVREIHGYDYEELYQVGAIGFIKAYRNYNGAVNFSTYLGTVIRNELFMYIRKNKKHQDLLSLNATFNDEETMTYGDLIADGTNYEELIIQEFQNEELRQCISELTDEERMLINQYMHKDISQKELGKKLGIAQSYVSRCQLKAIEKLKKMLERGKINIMAGTDTKITYAKIRELLKAGKNNTEITTYLMKNFKLTKKTAQTYLFKVKREFEPKLKNEDIKEIVTECVKAAEQSDETQKEEIKVDDKKSNLEILEIHVKGIHNQYRITLDKVTLINPSDVLSPEVLEEYQEVMAFKSKAINSIGA